MRFCFILRLLVGVALVGGAVGKLHAQATSVPGEMDSWTQFNFAGIGPQHCQVSATVNFGDFLAHMSVVRETWLNRDYSADFYSQRGMSTLAYVVSKKIGSMMTYITYETERGKNAGLCSFRIYVLTQDKFGNDKTDLLVSWIFTHRLADRIDWKKFDDKNFAKVAENYTFGPDLQRLTSSEPPPASDQTGRAGEPSSAPSAGADGSPDVKDLAVFTGQCRFQLIKGFFPCDRKVAFAHLKNGRSILTFMKGDSLFHLSGGRDRQPNLENYYLTIDTFAMKLPDREEAVDREMEGECHFRLNKDATKFFFVKCDIYNRAKGSMYNFYLETIEKTDHRAS
jgi:hypothetical protein